MGDCGGWEKDEKVNKNKGTQNLELEKTIDEDREKR